MSTARYCRYVKKRSSNIKPLHKVFGTFYIDFICVKFLFHKNCIENLATEVKLFMEYQ